MSLNVKEKHCIPIIVSKKQLKPTKNSEKTQIIAIFQNQNADNAKKSVEIFEWKLPTALHAECQENNT